MFVPQFSGSYFYFASILFFSFDFNINYVSTQPEPDNDIRKLRFDIETLMPWPLLNSLPYRNTALQIVPRGGSIPIGRHHVIPRSRLSTFFNKLFKQGDASRLTNFWNQLSQHVESISTLNPAQKRDVQTVIHFFRPNYETRPDHIPVLLLKPGWEMFWRVLLFLPFNLFEGPTNRKPDPGDVFDYGALCIIPKDRYDLLWDFNRQITGYRPKMSDRDFAQLDSNLETLFREHKAIIDLSPEKWTMNPVVYGERITFRISSNCRNT